MSEFDSFEPEIQYYAVTGFHRFLWIPPTLDNCPEDICDEEIRKNQEEWNLGKEVKNFIPSNADPSAVEAGAYGAATKRVILEERKDWNEEIDEIKDRGNTPILVGGTGQYIWSLVENWDLSDIPPNNHLRKDLDFVLQNHGIKGLQEFLLKLPN